MVLLNDQTLITPVQKFGRKTCKTPEHPKQMAKLCVFRPCQLLKQIWTDQTISLSRSRKLYHLPFLYKRPLGLKKKGKINLYIFWTCSPLNLHNDSTGSHGTPVECSHFFMCFLWYSRPLLFPSKELLQLPWWRFLCADNSHRWPLPWKHYLNWEGRECRRGSECNSNKSSLQQTENERIHLLYISLFSFGSKELLPALENESRPPVWVKVNRGPLCIM